MYVIALTLVQNITDMMEVAVIIFPECFWVFLRPPTPCKAS